MSDPLVIYLQDHLAGAMHAIEVLKAMRDHYAGEDLGQFATKLLVDIEADRDALETLIRKTGTSPGGVKEWGAWLSEKVGRLKLRHGTEKGLGTLEALEFLMLGIHGKWALWQALNAVAGKDSRLQGTDFNRLIARAEAQHGRVDERRLDFARIALKATTKS
jgi:hypothetical protein